MSLGGGTRWPFGPPGPELLPRQPTRGRSELLVSVGTLLNLRKIAKTQKWSIVVNFEVTYLRRNEIKSSDFFSLLTTLSGSVEFRFAFYPELDSSPLPMPLNFANFRFAKNVKFGPSWRGWNSDREKSEAGPGGPSGHRVPRAC